MITHSNHLHMALLQLSLHLVEVEGIKLIAGVGLHNITSLALLDRRRVPFLVIRRRGW